MSRPAELPYENTIHEALHITAVEVSPDRVVLQMPVDHTVHQPMGILHGGASAVIAESAASLGAWMNCSPEQYVVGTDLNISHLRARRDGTVTATAEPIRKGRTMHVWHIDITDEDGKRVAVARCTLVVRNVSELQG
jgi:1,4-dihydroxy-2-naphthoyl-CoA hydrolase